MVSNSGADATFRTDFWCFTDGPLKIDCDPNLSVDVDGDSTVLFDYDPESSTTLTVTDALGCTATSQFTVEVIDVSCKKNKVLVCHKGKKAICISENAVASHLAHGDTLGDCSSFKKVREEPEIILTETVDEDVLAVSELRIKAYPNPSSDQINFHFRAIEDERRRLEIFDISGNKITTVFEDHTKKGEGYQFSFDATGLNQGVYSYRFHTKNGVQTKLLIIK